MARANIEQVKSALSSAREKGLLASFDNERLQHTCARMVKRLELVAPYRGMYAERAHWEAMPLRDRALCIIRSLAARHPSWVFCSHSAALLHGLEVSHAELKTVHVIGARTGNSAVRFHNLKRIEPVAVDGIRATSLERTISDCVCANGFKYGLATIDSALRLLGVGADTLRSRLEGVCGMGRRGRYVLGVAAFGDARSENGGESYARAVMIEHGVLMPELQVELYDEVSQSAYRIDYGWSLHDRYVAGELDGSEKYEELAKERGVTAVDVMREERLRESRCRNNGVIFARFSFAQVVKEKPLLAILDSCGVPRIGKPYRIPVL